MKAFFLLLGLAIGAYLSYTSSIWEKACVLVFAILILLLSFKKKVVPYFLAGLVVGALLLLLSFPASSGVGNYSGLVIKASENYFILWSKGVRYYVYSKGHGYEVGDIIDIYGKASSYNYTTYESQTVFGQYLNSNGVYNQISAYTVSFFFKNPLRLRAFEKGYLAFFNDNAATLIDALLFNHKDYTSSLISDAEAMNLLYLFSSSGIYFGMFTRLFKYLLGLKIRKERAVDFIVLLLATFLFVFYYTKVGVMRVYLCLVLSFVNQYALKKRFNRLEIISLSGIILFIIDRHYLLQDGFLLGYGISYCLYFLNGYLRSLGKRKRKIVVLGIIWLFLLPASLVYSNGNLHVLSLLFSQFLIPILLLFVLLAFIGIITYPLWFILNPFGDGIASLLSFLSSIDIQLGLPLLSVVGASAFYILFVFGLLMMEIKWKKVVAGLTIIGISVYLVSLVPIVAMFTCQISFINVGQGDAILIRDNLSTVMIDTGGNLYTDLATETLIPFLRKNRIYKIDALIASHSDYDHIGAASSLMEHFPVASYIEDAFCFPLTIGNMEFVNYNTYATSSSEENETSLVLGLELMGKYWLFTGDATSSIEKQIIADYPNLDCDVLKAGHHGSSTSTCEEWLDAITPSVAIISVGAANSYGHPTSAVLNRLEERNIKIRRTDLEGTITYLGWAFP